VWVRVTQIDLKVPRTSELTCEMNLYLRCDLPDVSCAEAAASCFFSCICCTCRSAQHMPSASARLANGPHNALHANRDAAEELITASS